MCEEMNILNIFLTVVLLHQKKAFSYLYSCKSFFSYLYFIFHSHSSLPPSLPAPVITTVICVIRFIICPEMAEDEISKMILESKQSVTWANFLALMKEIVISKKNSFRKVITEKIIIPFSFNFFIRSPTDLYFAR